MPRHKPGKNASHSAELEPVAGNGLLSRRALLGRGAVIAGAMGDQDAIALWNANLDAGAKVAKATGAKEMWQSRGGMPTSHLHGGTIMGTSAESSVVDSYGRTHEVPNLWVAGPGVFPSEGASNPTFTIFAVSQRGAEQLVKSWGSVAG